MDDFITAMKTLYTNAKLISTKVNRQIDNIGIEKDIRKSDIDLKFIEKIKNAPYFKNADFP
jgi:hypothetical protein